MRVCQFRHFGPGQGLHLTDRDLEVKGPIAPGELSEPMAEEKVISTNHNDEAWLVGCYISPYHHVTDANHDPERRRKLLLHKREIARLLGKVAERGLTLIPLRLYFKGGRVKVELGLARGKKLHDKRATLRERESRREIEKETRARQRA